MSTSGLNRDVVFNNVIALSAAYGDLSDPESPFMVINLDRAAAALLTFCTEQGWSLSRQGAVRYVRQVMAEQVKSSHAVKLGPATWDAAPFVMWAKWQMSAMLRDSLPQGSRSFEILAEEANEAESRYKSVSLFPLMPF